MTAAAGSPVITERGGVGGYPIWPRMILASLASTCGHSRKTLELWESLQAETGGEISQM